LKNIKGSMNIDFDEYYDKEDDIYYVTFKTGEPSYVVEVDDVLLIEMGLFTDLPTGFRILNFHKNKITSIAFLTKKIKKAMEKAEKEHSTNFRRRENRIEHLLEKVLAD
jgi:hypothetical protein